MQFESRDERATAMVVALSVLIDVVTAVLVVWFFDGDFLGFLAVVVGLQILYLLLWIRQTIVDWTLYALQGRRLLSAHLLKGLKQYQYPEPAERERSTEGYLSRVLEDESTPVMLRLKAAFELGCLAMYRQQGQLQAIYRLTMAWEDALESYKDSFPPPARKV